VTCYRSQPPHGNFPDHGLPPHYGQRLHDGAALAGQQLQSQITVDHLSAVLSTAMPMPMPMPIPAPALVAAPSVVLPAPQETVSERVRPEDIDALSRRVNALLRQCTSRLAQSCAGTQGSSSEQERLAVDLREAEDNFGRMGENWRELKDELEAVRSALISGKTVSKGICDQLACAIRNASRNEAELLSLGDGAHTYDLSRLEVGPRGSPCGHDCRHHVDNARVAEAPHLAKGRTNLVQNGYPDVQSNDLGFGGVGGGGKTDPLGVVSPHLGGSSCPTTAERPISAQHHRQHFGGGHYNNRHDHHRSPSPSGEAIMPDSARSNSTHLVSSSCPSAHMSATRRNSTAKPAELDCAGEHDVPGVGGGNGRVVAAILAAAADPSPAGGTAAVLAATEAATFELSPRVDKVHCEVSPQGSSSSDHHSVPGDDSCDIVEEVHVSAESGGNSLSEVESNCAALEAEMLRAHESQCSRWMTVQQHQPAL